MRRLLTGQAGQAIVLIALLMVVLIGFLGLAVDGGRAYLDRRELQGATDGAALAAAHDYMNSSSYDEAERAATAVYADNERLYEAPSCTGYGSASVQCTFPDPSAHVLTITVTNWSVAGVLFKATGRHRIPVALMQVLGIGTTIPVSATATAIARHRGTNGAAIQTLSPACTGGVGTISLAFTGTSTTTVVGDVWSNGAIQNNGSAGGSIVGNAVDVCPAMPPVPLPSPAWTVSGVETNGLSMSDPGYAAPALNTSGQTWGGATGKQVVQLPGTYSGDPRLTGGASCYFLSPGVYDFAGGFTDNGGFVSNELRPPDEPSTTTTSAALTGTVTSIPVAALAASIGGGTALAVGGQTFTVASAGAALGATTVPVLSKVLTATIAAGAAVSGRAGVQFWDANGVHCGGTFQPYPAASTNPLAAQAWAVEVTAVRSECVGASCLVRESPPSECRVADTASAQALQVWIQNVPGAQSYNVYVDPTGTCAGRFGRVTAAPNAVTESNNRTTGCEPQFGRNAVPALSGCDLGTAAVTVDSTLLPAGWDPTLAPAPPPPEGGALGAGLPNQVPPAGSDRANEHDCVDTNADARCDTTPGAVTYFIPGGGSTSVCLNLQGGGDVYLFSGIQYGNILLYEPGYRQAPPPNTCSNNINGHGLTSLLGIFYMPAANAVITGNSGYFATIAGGVIAWTAEIKGNGAVSITADPTMHTWPAVVHLVQ